MPGERGTEKDFPARGMRREKEFALNLYNQSGEREQQKKVIEGDNGNMLHRW